MQIVAMSVHLPSAFLHPRVSDDAGHLVISSGNHQRLILLTALYGISSVSLCCLKDIRAKALRMVFLLDAGYSLCYVVTMLVESNGCV